MLQTSHSPFHALQSRVSHLIDSFYATSNPSHSVVLCQGLELEMLSGSPELFSFPRMRIQNLNCNKLITKYVLWSLISSMSGRRYKQV